MNPAIKAAMDRVDWRASPPPADTTGDLPFVTHEGVFRLGDFKFRCYQLSSGQRLLDADDFDAAFGLNLPVAD